MYKRHPSEKKKQVYVIQLHGLIFLKDADKITSLLFEKHSGYLHPDVISPAQVKRFVQKLMDYIQRQIDDYAKNQQMHQDYEQ
jgi:Tfp pilus assembly PilM family ATPase